MLTLMFPLSQVGLALVSNLSPLLSLVPLIFLSQGALVFPVKRLLTLVLA